MTVPVKHDPAEIALTRENGLFVEGRLSAHPGMTFLAKVYDVPSHYGIGGGRISKLSLQDAQGEFCTYSRGWDQTIPPEAAHRLEALEAVVRGFPDDEAADRSARGRADHDAARRQNEREPAAQSVPAPPPLSDPMAFFQDRPPPRSWKQRFLERDSPAAPRNEPDIER